MRNQEDGEERGANAMPNVSYVFVAKEREESSQDRKDKFNKRDLRLKP